MALIDDPQAWILRLFEMEICEGRGSNCARYVEGIQPPDLPLEKDERVFGIYKDMYYFTPLAIIVRQRTNSTRIPWAEIASCSTCLGEASNVSKVTLVGGRTFSLLGLATGWSGRISQLFHQMIERHGHRAAIGRPLMSFEEFFRIADDSYCIAPNLEPHPDLEEFKRELRLLANQDNETKVFFKLVDDSDEVPVTDEIVILTPRRRQEFCAFAEQYGADGVIPADEQTVRLLGAVPAGCNVWTIVWD